MGKRGRKNIIESMGLGEHVIELHQRNTSTDKIAKSLSEMAQRSVSGSTVRRWLNSNYKEKLTKSVQMIQSVKTKAAPEALEFLSALSQCVYDLRQLAIDNKTPPSIKVKAHQAAIEACVEGFDLSVDRVLFTQSVSHEEE
tara:strand:- start:7817 stop:8239 length:423 start_codon:yes stop_codon:yes gene_type:complete